MTAYYNENDPYAAQWLRNLIAAGEIPDGEVDARSILDVRADDLDGFDQCHFFAGIGGWPYALELAGWTGPVWTGSCPCQPLSSAGQRRGHADERHLWPAFYRLIALCRPATVFGEQVASRDGREWLAGVRADLEHLGYAVGAADLPAAGVGAPHIRQRLFWVADAQIGAEQSRRRLADTSERVERSHAARPEQFARRDGATGGLADATLGRERSLDRQPRPDARPQEPPGGHGVSGWLADAEHALGRAQQQRDALDRRDAGRPQEHRQPGARREVRGLGDADAARPQGRREHAGECAGQRPARTAGYAGGLGHTDSARECPLGRVLRGAAAERSRDPWADALWLPCLDGRARRVEPTIQPLVDARGCICSLRLGEVCACAEKPSRVGMLRGAGNAISPPVAAEFVKAVMECLALTHEPG